MRKTLRRFMAITGIMICLVTNAGAIDNQERLPSTFDEPVVASIMRATGSFNIDVRPYTKAKGDTDFPMEAGESIRIRATYSPEDASVDFGLVDPDGIFHYLSAESGVFDETFEIPERGNYRLGIKNNSSQKVSVSGFVNY